MPSKSNDTKSGCARLVALLLATAVVITAVPALILFNVQRGAFEAATYERALADKNFYQQFPSMLADVVQRNLGADTPAFLQRITHDQWTVVLQMLLPETQMKSMTNDALTQAFAFVNGEAQNPQVSVAALKEGLLGPAGVEAALYILHQQPECTLDQAAAMLASPGNEICNPPQQFVDMARPLIQSEMQQVAASLPDEVPLLRDPSAASVQSPLRDIQTGRTFMQVGLALPLLLLLALTVLAVRSLKELLVWWGWPLLLTGLLGMPASLLASPVLAWIVERLLMANFAAILPTAVADSLSSILEATLREMLQPAAWESAILFVTGLVAVLNYYALRGRTNNTRLPQAGMRA